MKCEFCGANIDIESPVCPHCGMQKRQFEQHRSDMNRFTQEFQTVRDDVVEENKRFSKKASYITVLCVLIAINLLLLVCRASRYDIYYYFVEKKVNNNAEKYAAVLDQYETDGEYEHIYSYYTENDLYRADDDSAITEYKVLYRFCASYETFTQYFPYFAINGYEPEYYDPAYCETYIEYAVDAYENMAKLYGQVLEQDAYVEYGHPEVYSDRHMASYERIMNNIDALLQTYCGFDDEDLQKFKSASKTRKILMLEEIKESEVSADET